MISAFNRDDVDSLKARIHQLTTATRPLWGKMNSSRMLAHCNVTYELVYDPPAKRPNAVLRFLLKVFVKPAVVNEKPYKRSLRTAPYFVISDEREFDKEQARLLAYMDRTLALGAASFEGRESYSFGALTAQEWSNMFTKHLEHHLAQFGV